MAVNLRLGSSPALVVPIHQGRAGPTRGREGRVLPPREKQSRAFRDMPGLAPMLAAALLARTGATMVGLSMGFVAYEQTASAFTVAVVAASFGLAFAASSLIAGHVLARIGLRAMLVGALASQFAGALALASVTSTAGADVTWLIIFSVVAGLASAFIFVGSQMLLHGVAPGEHLQRAVSLDAATMSVSRIAGPALGGILLAVIGIPPVFLLAACCYLPLLGVVAVLAARLNDPPPARRPRLREAARFFGQLRILRGALLMAFGLTISIGRTLLLTSVHVASPDSHRAHVLSLYIFVTAAATPIGALLWGVVADWLNIDATLGGAGVLLMFGIGAGLIS